MKRRLLITLVLLLLCIGGIGWFSYMQQKTVVLKFGMFAGSNWDGPNGDSYKIIDQAIERFEKAHPNVRVEYVSGLQKADYSEWLSQQALEGDLPDVYMVLSDDLYTFADIGMLEELDSYIQRDEKLTVKNYFTPALKSGQMNGRQYALPYESVPTMMYVNKTLLDKFGIALPDNNWTWDDFYTICEKVTLDSDHDGSMDTFGVYGYGWQNALASNDATIFNASGTSATLANDKVYEAVEFTRKLEELNKGQSVNSAMFDKGMVAFCPMKFSEYRTYKPYPWRVKKYTNFEWDCIPMPAGPEGDNVSQLDTLSMGISASSSHKKLAWEFLKSLCYDTTAQKDIFKYSQGVSVLKDITGSKQVMEYLLKDAPGDSTFNMDFFNDTMEHAIPNTKFTDYDQVISVADSEIRRLLGTDEDIKTSINTLQTKIDLILKK